MGSINKRIVIPVVLICLYGSHPDSVHAQQVQRAPALEEIIVTAQKREQNLKDVPIAISALSRKLLEDNEIDSVQELADFVPSLRFTEHNTAANRNIRIRGVGTEVRNNNSETNVSIVVDGVPLARTDVASFEFADLERVEVLRGPQGTLFGKNSTAGVVHVITRDPAPEFEAFARANYETQQDWPGSLYKIQMGVSFPITDSMGMRLTGFYKEIEGHLDDVLQNEHPPNTEARGFRGKLRWDPSESLKVILGLESQRINGVTIPLVFRDANPDKAANEEDIHFHEENRQTKTFGNDKENVGNDAASLNVEWRLDGINLSSITGWRDYEIDNLRSSPNLAGDGVDVMGVGGVSGYKTFTQEFRITSTDVGKLDYTTGVLWFVNRPWSDGGVAPAHNIPASQFAQNTGLPGAFDAVSLVSGVAGLPGVIDVDIDIYPGRSKTENLGIFGQFTWHMSDVWHLTAGARHIDENQKVSFEGSKVVLSDSATGTPVQESESGPREGEISDSHVTGMISLQRDFGEHTTVYGTVATGYRGGFIEIGREDFEEAIENPVEAETVVNVEIGSKSRLLGGSLELNTAVFRSVFKDFQSLVLFFESDPTSVTPPGEFKIQNAGELETRGVEIDIRARPLPLLSVVGSILYNKAEFKEFISECFPGQQPGESGGRDYNDDGICDDQDVSGGVLPNAPKLSASLITRVDLPLEDENLVYFQLAGRWQDEVLFDARQHPGTIQDAYSIWNLRLGWTGLDDRMQVAAYVNNLFDEFYVGGMFGLSLHNSRRDVIHFVPASANRQFGLSVGYSW